MKLNPIELLHVALLFKSERLSVGRLALHQGRILFEYDAGFLSKGLLISPFKLPLREGVFLVEDRVFEGLFGVFNDSLPDGWGRLLLDRAAQSRGVAYQRLTPLDRLAHVGDHGMGALIYRPDHSDGTEDGKEVNLQIIRQEVDKVLEGGPTEILRELLQLGGSSAGARPKILVGYRPGHAGIVHGPGKLPADYEPWLIKFPSSLDQPDIGAIEYAYSEMARAAGVEVPPARLFTEASGRAYFGVKRFDRSGNDRMHMHTAAGLLHADHRIPSLDYENLLRCALALTRSMAEVEKAYRLAVFNVFAHNRDDHSKNFSFLMNEHGKWSFAPAYDLTFSYGPGGEHCSMVMGEGRNPGAGDLRKLAAKFQVKRADAIIEEVRDATSRWMHFAREAGVSFSSRGIIQKELNRSGR